MPENQWFDDIVINNLKKKLAARMVIACEFTTGNMKLITAGHVGSELKAVDKGQYLNSFVHDVIEMDGEIVGVVANTAGHSPFIEFGTGQYAESGNGRQTPWFWKDENDVWHFTRGMKPRPIMRTGFDESQNGIKQILGAE
ncbi:MAG: hypothetical protein RDU14_17515 [Melioribacteraceae bacterium]|nr:hypothetical protein [Melioribacteraceae bacterium]